jgi:hypothetical protein
MYAKPPVLSSVSELLNKIMPPAEQWITETPNHSGQYPAYLTWDFRVWKATDTDAAC